MLGFFLVMDKMAHVVFGIGALLTARAMAADGGSPDIYLRSPQSLAS
jgi:hypothetical protein